MGFVPRDSRMSSKQPCKRAISILAIEVILYSGDDSVDDLYIKDMPFVVLLFYVHGKHLWSYRLPYHTFPGQP